MEKNMFANLLNLKKTYQQQLAWRKSKLPLSYLYLMIVIYLIAAWFSEGYAHADEHYQILEFAAYHIHHYPYIYPWELTAQIRPTLEIWIVIWLYKIAMLLSWQINPFMLAFLTRALTGCLSALSCDSCRLYDGIKTHFNRAHWIDKSVLFRQNGRLYKVS